MRGCVYTPVSRRTESYTTAHIPFYLLSSVPIHAHPQCSGQPVLLTESQSLLLEALMYFLPLFVAPTLQLWGSLSLCLPSPSLLTLFILSPICAHPGLPAFLSSLLAP